MIVTIVGATGVLGRNLVPRLLDEGWQVRAIARSCSRVKELYGEGVEAIEADLMNPGPDKSWRGALTGSDAVIHIATAIPNDPMIPGAWDRNTQLRTEGTRYLLNAALSAGVKYYIQQSIVMAYPDSGDLWIDESTPLDPSPLRSSITQPVIEMESLVRSIPNQKMEWCILRGGVFVGMDTFQDRTIHNLQTGEEVVPCDGHNFVSYVHAADMASAICLALKIQPSMTILNITAEPVRQNEYLDRLAIINETQVPHRALNAPCSPSIRCSHQVAQEILGWIPARSIIRRLDED
jgi:2-alkyl-3-oxoalkanoate reductase